MNKQIRIIAVLLVLLLALSACGKKNENPSPVATSESLPTATAEPSAVPSEEPGDIGTEDLDEPRDIGTEDLDDPEPVGDKMDGPDKVSENMEEAVSVPMEKAEESPDIPDTDDIPVQIIDPETVGHVQNSTEYENYLNMSGDEQVAFIESFDSPADFAAWFNAVQAEYEVDSNPIEVTTGVIDLGEVPSEDTE